MRFTLSAIVFVVAPVASAFAQAPPKVVDVTHEPSHHLALSNEHVRVFNVIVAPHTTTLIHRHDRDYMFVTYGENEITTQRVGDSTVHLTLHDGEVRFTPGGFAHSAEVLSDHPFHNSTIELLEAGDASAAVHRIMR